MVYRFSTNNYCKGGPSTEVRQRPTTEKIRRWESGDRRITSPPLTEKVSSTVLNLNGPYFIYRWIQCPTRAAYRNRTESFSISSGHTLDVHQTPSRFSSVLGGDTFE